VIGCEIWIWVGLSLWALNFTIAAAPKPMPAIAAPAVIAAAPWLGKLVLCRLLPREFCCGPSLASTFVPGITSVNPNATIAMRQISFIIIDKFVLLHKKLEASFLYH
jgi:hypothetical protein